LGLFFFFVLCCGGDLDTTATARSNRSHASGSNSISGSLDLFAMPRQPLLPIIRRNPGGQFDIGTHALGLRPELELVVAKCLMAWPPAEAEMALLLAPLLGADESEAVLAVFHSLRRSSAQRDAISEAGRITLHDTDRELLNAILNAHKSIESERNALTHGHFGIYTHLLDGLVWMETKDYVDFKARMDLANEVFTDKTRDKFYSNLFVYRKQDLEKIFDDINEIAHIWHAFISYLRSQPPQRAELYRQLCDRKHIRPELEKLRREKTPPARS
jgi:hypothetical protein